MANVGTFRWVRVKIRTKPYQEYKREGETDWVATKESLAASYKLISEIVVELLDILIERSPHNGLDPTKPPVELDSISWNIYNGRTNKLVKGGRYTELKEGDPPIAFMTPLLSIVDEALEQYHEARKAKRRNIEVDETKKSLEADQAQETQTQKASKTPT